MTKRKYLIKIILPLCFATFFTNIFARYFERQIILKPACSPSYKINRIINELHRDETPIFGSSRVEEDIDPKILGKNYFNYGIPEIQGSITLFYLNAEISKNKKTPIIINFDYAGDFTATGGIDNYLVNIDDINIRKVVQTKLYYNVPFFKYYGLYEYYLKIFIGQTFGTNRYQFLGSNIYKESLNREEFLSAIKMRERKKDCFSDHNKYYRELKKIITDNQNREFIFVVAPYHKSFFVSFSGESKALKFLSLLQEYKNVKVINCSRTQFDDNLFYDTIHLNYAGAVKYSNIIKDSISYYNRSVASRKEGTEQ